MANPLLIAQAVQVAVKHRRKIVAVLMLPLVLGWAAMFVGLLAVGALAGVGTSGEAGHQKNNLEDEPGRDGATVPAELVEPLQAAGQECDQVNPSLLAATAAETSGWDVEHDEGGRSGLMWLPVEAVAAHGVDVDGDGVADPLDAHEAIATLGAWLCDLAARPELAGIEPVAELVAHNFAQGAVGWAAVVRDTAIGALVVQAQPSYQWLDLPSGPDGPGQWGPPVHNPQWTSRYSAEREHPVYGDVRAHTGTDLRGVCGTPIWAAAAGTVTFAGSTGDGYGNWIEILHGAPGDQVKTRYAHIEHGGLLVSAGQQVDQGFVVGRVGSTGASTACHLHFEVRPGPGFGHIDPEPFMAARGVPFTKAN